MRINHIIICRINGLYSKDEKTNAELIPPGRDGGCSVITSDVHEYYLGLRRIKAFGMTMASAFMGNNSPEASQSVKDRFDIALTRVTLSEPASGELFLVASASSQADVVELGRSFDLGGFRLGYDLFEASRLSSVAEGVLMQSFSGLLLASPDHTTDTLYRVGTLTFAVDDDGTNLSYTTSMTISGSMTSQWPLTSEIVGDAAAIAQAFRKSPDLESVARLLSISADQQQNQLMSFMAAWNALEIFLSKVFGATYEPEFHSLFEKAAPSSALPFVNRVRDVMKGKYNIRDKFVAVSAALDPINSSKDYSIFNNIKEIRDNIAHSMKNLPSSLPAEQTRSLARKYLKLHIERGL